MKLLLLSLGTGAVAEFVTRHAPASAGTRRIGYISDAAAPYDGLPFVAAERSRIDALGHDVVDIRVRDTSSPEFATVLGSLDAVYVAGGSTFALLEALRSNGTGAVLADRVRAGLPYIGTSAGSIIAGPSITPASLLDDPADAPALSDFAGLHLIERVVIPHADGRLPQYPPSLIDETLSTYGAEYPLIPLSDDQALLVVDGLERIVQSPLDAP